MQTNKRGFAAVVVFLGGCFAACAGNEGTPQGDFNPDDFETYVAKKEDTGYVSNKAAELEARLTSKVFIDMTGKTPEEIASFAESLKTANRWTLEEYTSPQLKYARNPIKSEKLDLNLERGEAQILETKTTENGVWMTYSTAIESLVKFKELQDKGLTPQDLVGKKIEFLLPTQPEIVWEKGGIACASDPDGAQLNPADVRADNFFYYFDPKKPGCPLQSDTDLAQSNYEVISSLDARSVYPEYDLLIQDKKITMAAIFGQIEHGELKDGDWGWRAYGQFLRKFQYEGFTRVKTFDNNFGEQIRKVYPGGLEVVIDFITPEALKDARPREEVNQYFLDWIKNHEIVYYNGHAFYGSLTVLDSREAYPEDSYQIIFMDACWSYAYYTKQVFKNKVSDSDPTGMKYVDVVNNTEPGITGSEETAFLLYKNILKGASDLAQGRAPTKYSWNNLIVYMNENAEKRAQYYDPTQFQAEIYGVSGVSTNCFNPKGDSFCQE